MEWSQPDTQGAHINPRSGHAGTMIDENWYIVGGGDNASGNSWTHDAHIFILFAPPVLLK